MQPQQGLADLQRSEPDNGSKGQDPSADIASAQQLGDEFVQPYAGDDMAMHRYERTGLEHRFEEQDDNDNLTQNDDPSPDAGRPLDHVWRLGQSCTIYDMAVLVPELQKKLTCLSQQPEHNSAVKVQLDCQTLQELDAAGVQLLLSLAKALQPGTLELYWPNIPDSCTWFIHFIAQHQQHLHLSTTNGAHDV
jgi:ABC-type transporter Mla MlaB component